MSLRPLYRNNPGSTTTMINQQRSAEAKAYIVVDGNRPHVDVEREMLQVKGIESCLSQTALRGAGNGSEMPSNEEFYCLEDESGKIEAVYDFDDSPAMRSNNG